MSLRFDLRNENNNSKVRVEINDKQLLIEFIPVSNLKIDLEAAAIKRDRFNFCISYMLHQVIESKIDYEENLDLKKLILNGFAVLLQFNQKIDFKLMKSIFVSDTFTVSYFSEFFSEINREEIISSSEIYFDKQNEMYAERYTEKEEMSIPERLEQIKNDLSSFGKGVDIFSDYQTENHYYPMKKEELEQSYLQENEVMNDMLIKCDVMIQTTMGMLSELDVQLQKSMLKVQSDKPAIDEDEEIISIVESSSIQYDTSLCQSLSMELLERNVIEKEPVLMYVTYGNQLKFRQKMKKEKCKDYDIYDDIFLNKNRFGLFNNDDDLKKSIENVSAKSGLSDSDVDELFRTRTVN